MSEYYPDNYVEPDFLDEFPETDPEEEEARRELEYDAMIEEGLCQD